MKRTILLVALLLYACSSNPEELVEETLCEPGIRQCNTDNTGMDICQEDGLSWQADETCIAGATCIDGTCHCPLEQAYGADSCVATGIESCPAAFFALDNGCDIEPPACGAGEIATGGACHKVGIPACLEDGWEPDNEGGCQVQELPCSEDKNWSIATGCVWSGLEQTCGSLDSPWGDIPDAEEIIFVWADSPEGVEEGTQSRPYKTLAEAISKAPDNALVLIGEGEYTGGLSIDKPVSILGKCAEYVTINGAAEFQPAGADFPHKYAFFIKPGGAVEMGGFKLTDSDAGENLAGSGIYLEGATSAQLHDIHFIGLAGTAIDLRSSKNVTVHNIHVYEQTQHSGLNPYGNVGYGIYGEDCTNMLVEHSRFYKTKGADIKAVASCPSIRFNHFEKRGGLGSLPPMGVWIKDCADGQSEISGNYFLDKMTHAILVEGGNSLIERNTILGTVTDYADANGPAIKVNAPHFTIRENLLRENQYAGLNVANGKGTIEYNRVESSLPSDPGLKNGDGIIVKGCDPGPVTISFNTVTNNYRNGILVSSSIAAITDNVIRDTKESPISSSTFGAGINVAQGADVTVSGNSITGNERIGVRFHDAYGKVDANVIAGTKDDKDGRCGGAITVLGTNGTYLQGGITNNLLSDNYGSGIYIDNSTVPSIKGNAILDTRGAKDTLGIGIISRSSKVTVEENWLADNADAGMLYESSSGGIYGNIVSANGISGSGGGIIVQDISPPMLEIHENTFSGNGLAGFIGHESVVELRRNVFLDQVPSGSGLGGAGAWLENNCEGEVRTNYMRGNLLAGLMLYDIADITMSVNYIVDTGLGSLPGEDSPLQYADGIVVSAGSVASALYNSTINNARSGLLFLDAEGFVSGNTARGNTWWGLEAGRSGLTLEVNNYQMNGQGETASDSERLSPAQSLGPWTPCKQD